MQPFGRNATAPAMLKPVRRPKPSLQLDLNVVKDNMPRKVIRGLYVGSLYAACNKDELLRRGINHVLNISGEVNAQYSKRFTYLSIDLRDKDYSNLLSCLPAANIFIKAGMTKGAVLVHCRGGRSRSPAVIVAYLMSVEKMSFQDSTDLVRRTRPIMAINKGFIRQLVTYERSGFDIYKAQQILLRHRVSQMAEARKNTNISSPRRISRSCVRLPARLRLTCPGSPTVSIIPPLRGMDLEFICRECQTMLFISSSVLRHTPGRDRADDNDNDGAAAGSASSRSEPWGRRRGSSDGSSAPTEPRSIITRSASKLGDDDSDCSGSSEGEEPEKRNRKDDDDDDVLASAEGESDLIDDSVDFDSPEDAASSPSAATATAIAARDALDSSPTHAVSQPDDDSARVIATVSRNSGNGAAFGALPPLRARGPAPLSGGGEAPMVLMMRQSMPGSVVEPPTPSSRRRRERGGGFGSGGFRQQEILLQEQENARRKGDVLKALPPRRCISFQSTFPTRKSRTCLSPMAESPFPARSTRATSTSTSTLDTPMSSSGSDNDMACDADDDTTQRGGHSPVKAEPSKHNSASSKRSQSITVPMLPLHLATAVAPSTLTVTELGSCLGNGHGVLSDNSGSSSSPSSPTHSNNSSNSSSCSNMRSRSLTPPSGHRSRRRGRNRVTSAGSSDRSQGLSTDDDTPRTQERQRALLLDKDSLRLRTPGRASSPETGKRFLRRWRAIEDSGEWDHADGDHSLELTEKVVQKDLQAAVISCDQCFVEPMEWMGPLQGSSGALLCPNKKCQAELGIWDWHGSRCTCGVHVKPCFALRRRCLYARERPLTYRGDSRRRRGRK